MAEQNLYKNLLFDGSSYISGVTKISINSDASGNDDAVRLSQMNTALTAKQDNLSAGGAIDATALASNTVNVVADGINDTHIDFGTGANQVNATDLPITDSGGNFTATEVESTLLEIWNRSVNETIVEFSTAEFLENREGLVAFIVPSIYNGKRITGYYAKVTTKNDNVTLQLNKNGTIISSSSSTITTAAGVASSTLNETLATNDIIQVETTAVGSTFSKGLIVNITIEV